MSRFVLALVILALLRPPEIHGATATWTGAAGDSSWGNGANWTNASFPGTIGLDPSSIDTANFFISTLSSGGTAAAIILPASGISVQNVNFDTNPAGNGSNGTFTIGAVGASDPLYLTDNGILGNHINATQTINSPIIFTGYSYLLYPRNSGASLIKLNGTVTALNGGFPILITGTSDSSSAAVQFAGPVVDGTDQTPIGFTFNNAGTFIFSGSANTFSQGVTLVSTVSSQPTLSIGASGAPLGTGILTISGGNIGNYSGTSQTITANNPIVINNSFGFNQGGANKANLNLGNGPVTLNGSPITLSGGQNNTSLTFGGPVSDGGAGVNFFIAGSGTVATLSTLSITGTLGVTGGTYQPGSNATATAGVVLNGGTLLLSGTGGSVTTGSISVLPGSALTLDNSTQVYTAAGGRLSGVPVNLTGGTLNYKPLATANSTDSMGPLVANGGATSFFSASSTVATATSTFTIASLSATNHSTLNLFLANANSANGRIAVTSKPAFVGSTGTAGATLGILPWAVETSNSAFLTVNPTGGVNYIQAYGSGGFGSYSSTLTNASLPTDNVKLTGGALTLNGSASINSLTINQASAETLSLGGVLLRLNSGGLLQSGNFNGSITTGTLTAAVANPELYIHVLSAATNPLNISASIANPDSLTPLAVTKGDGGSLTLSGSNSYTGPTTVGEGNLTIAAGGVLATSTITLNQNNTVVSSLTNSGTIGTVISTASNATITLNGGSTTGPISLAGTLNINGSTALTVGKINATNNNGATIIFNNTFSGGTSLTFTGTNNFTNLQNLVTTGTLFLSGSGSINNFSGNTFEVGNALTAATTVQSGTFNMGAFSNGSNNKMGTLNVTGGAITFNSGRFFDSAGGVVNIAGGVFAITADRLTTDAGAAGTAITFNLSSGLFDIYNTGFAFGLGASTTNNLTDTVNQTGGTFQIGITAAGSNNNISIGNGTSTGSLFSYVLTGGTMRVNGSISSGGAAQASSTNAFNFRGGTLTAATINTANLYSNDGINAGIGTLFQAVGTLSPGDNYNGTQYTGFTKIVGNYTVDSGNIAIGINGLTPSSVFEDNSATYDNIVVTGTTRINGAKLLVSVTPDAALTLTPTSYITVLTASNPIIGAVSNFQNIILGTTNRIVALDSFSFFNVNLTGTDVTQPSASPVRVVLSGYSRNYFMQTTGTWGTSGSAPWTVLDPNSSSYGAQFGSSTVPVLGGTVTLNQSRTVEGLYFPNHGYTIVSASGAGLTLAAGILQPFINVSLSGTFSPPVTIAAPISISGTLGVNVAGSFDVAQINGGISGLGGLSLGGAGYLVFNGTANNYTGATSVSGATLVVNGSLIGTSSVAATNFGFVGGTGTIGAPVTIGSGGYLKPSSYSSVVSNTTATLTIGNSVTFTDQSTFVVSIDDGSTGNTPTADLLKVTGNVNLTGNDTLTVTLLNGSLNRNKLIYTILSTTGTITGQFVPDGSLPAPWVIQYTANTVTLVIPEPGEWEEAILGLSLAAGAVAWRRRSSGNAGQR